MRQIRLSAGKEVTVINEKMEHLGSVRSAIRELFEYGIKRKAQIGEDKVFDFSLGNPSVEPPEAVTEELTRLLNETEPTALHGYTSAAGDAGVRRAISEYISKSQGFDIPADMIYMTAGAAAALSCTLSALVCEGEEVIVLSPYFPEYSVFIAQAGGKVVEVPCPAPDFLPDAAAIEAAITSHTAAIIVNSPCNPTGAVYSHDCLNSVCEVLSRAEKRYAHPIYLICDEPYRELVYGDVTVPYAPSLYDNTVVCYSFSKSLSIPGDRIGYVAVSPRCTDSRRVFAAISGAGRSLGYVCAPSLLQRIIPECLGKVADLSVYDRNRRLLSDELTKLGFKVTEPQGAFYLFLAAPDGDESAFAEAAKRHELLLVPSTSFGCRGYVRISYCVKTDMIERALGAFRALAEEYFGE